MTQFDLNALHKRLSRLNINDNDHKEFANYLKDTIGGRQIMETWQAVVASDVSEVDLSSIKQFLEEVKAIAQDPARGQLSDCLQHIIWGPDGARGLGDDKLLLELLLKKDLSIFIPGAWTKCMLPKSAIFVVADRHVPLQRQQIVLSPSKPRIMWS
jgi:hypothetical protein